MKFFYFNMLFIYSTIFLAQVEWLRLKIKKGCVKFLIRRYKVEINTEMGIYENIIIDTISCTF